MPSAPTRRELLRALCALSTSALAGCVSDSTTDRAGESEPTTGTSTATTTTETRSSTTSPEPTEPARVGPIRRLGESRVAVGDPVAAKAVAYESVMGSGGVLAPEGRQFVVAAATSATGSGEFDAVGDPPRDAFTLVAGDRSSHAVDVEERTTGAYTTSLAGRGGIGYGTSYAETQRDGWLAFELPSPTDVENAAIRCEHAGETATWPLPEDAVAILSRPAPTFELRTFEVEQIDPRSVELSFVAENTGSVDGEFLAAVYWPTERIADDDESTLVREDVTAGERIEWRRAFDTEYTAFEDGPVTARLDGVVTGSATGDVDVPTTT